MVFGISFSPLVAVELVWAAAAVAAVVAALLVLARNRGALIRVGALALMVLALANPSLTREDRDPLTSVAGAWAMRQDGQAMLPLVTSEPRQREFAFRAGVNIVMYTLTGNYKADQVHARDLIERLSH